MNFFNHPFFYCVGRMISSDRHVHILELTNPLDYLPGEVALAEASVRSTRKLFVIITK